MKKIIVFLLALCTLLSVSSCSLFEPEAKTFQVMEMSITLNDQFYEQDFLGFTAAFSSTDMAVYVTREAKTDFEGTEYEEMTLDEYTRLVMQVNKNDGDFSYRGKYNYFTYEDEVSSQEWSFYSMMFKSSEAYWLVSFGVLKSNHDKFKDKIFEYADSIVIK